MKFAAAIAKLKPLAAKVSAWDAAFVAGFASLVGGVYLLSAAGAFIVGGVGLMVAGATGAKWRES